MKKIINSIQAPKAIGPYSQALQTGNMLFCSGQLPLNPKTMTIEATTIEEQTHQLLKNMGEVLKEAGYTYNDVIKTTCFMEDLNEFKAFNEVYALYFKTDCPARSTVQVAKLPLGAKIEIEAIAYKE